MAEHNFERRVRQEMSDLKIDPSDAVWENVKIRIEKKKDKRRFFILFFLLGLLLLGGGYIMLYSPQPLNTSETTFNVDKEKNNHESVTEDRAVNASPQKITDEDDKAALSKIDNTTPLNQAAAAPGKAANAPVSKVATQTTVSKTIFIKDNSTNKTKPVIVEGLVTKSGDKLKEDRRTSEVTASVITPPTPIKNEVDSTSVAIAIIKAEQNNDTTKATVPARADVLKGTENITSNIVTNDTLATIARVNSTKTSSAKHKWYFGFNVGGGLSHVGNSVFSADKALSYDYLGMPGSNANPGNYYGRITPLSPAKRSGAYSFGLFMQRELSKKATVSAGINYTNFAVSTLKGSSYDSVRLLVFSESTKKSYRNNFNFIEVPIEVNLQLGKRKKMPVYWHGGIGLSTLVSSNALQYKADTAASYYKDNSVFNKMQFGINTGLSIQLFKIKSSPLTIGPYFYYGLSALAREGVYNQQHFMFAGLSTQFLFKRK